MDEPSYLRFFVPSDIELRRHLLRAYPDSRGREVIYHIFLTYFVSKIAETKFGTMVHISMLYFSPSG